MKFDFDRYAIGDYVRMIRTFTMQTKNSLEKPSVYKRMRVDFLRRFDTIGQITGIKQFQTGTLDGAYDEGRWLNVETAFYCWEIRLGLKNKPIYALPENIRLLSPKEIKEIPVLRTVQPPWSDANRKQLSKEAKAWPRDGKGRFLPMAERI